MYFNENFRDKLDTFYFLKNIGDIMGEAIVFGLVKSLHDIATAIWIGGLIHMSLTILPTFRNVNDEKMRKQLMMILQNRLSILVYISIVMLVVTGILESWHSQAFRGFFSFSNVYSSLLSIKHLLVIAMIAIAIVRQLTLRQMRKTKDKAKNMAKEKASIAMILVNTLIGVVVVFLSGFLAAFS